MADFNRVILAGRITRDIELKYTNNNTAIASIGIAVNRTFKDGSGEKQEETTFVDCTAWGRTAEVMSEYLHKGAPVMIEGRLKLDQWEDKNTGDKRSKLSVVIENFQFMESKNDPNSTGGGGGSRGSNKGSRSKQTADSAPW